MTWKEFSELSKAKFVAVATADFGIRGRPTNGSRVAILTGLDRRDVRRLRRAAKPEPQGYQRKASQILSAWHHEPDFLDASGRPAALAVEGEGATFTELMRRHAAALPVVAMIKELKNAEAIEERSDGRLRALKRAYVPSGVSAERLRLWSGVLSDIANTIEHNHSRDDATPARFERRALSLAFDRKALPEETVLPLCLCRPAVRALVSTLAAWVPPGGPTDGRRVADAGTRRRQPVASRLRADETRRAR